jgi:hypothetical protein
MDRKLYIAAFFFVLIIELFSIAYKILVVPLNYLFILFVYILWLIVEIIDAIISFLDKAYETCMTIRNLH